MCFLFSPLVINMIMVQHLVAANAHSFANATANSTASPSPSPPLTSNGGGGIHSPLASPTNSTSSTSQQTMVSTPLSSPAAGDILMVDTKLTCNLTEASSSTSSVNALKRSLTTTVCSPRDHADTSINWSTSVEQNHRSDEEEVSQQDASNNRNLQMPSAICQQPDEEVETHCKRAASQSPQHTPSTSPALSQHSTESAPTANSQDPHTISTCRQKFAVLYNHLRQQHQPQPSTPPRQDCMEVEQAPPVRRSVITSREEEDSLSQERSASSSSVEHLHKDLDERHYHEPPSDHYHSDDEDFDDEAPLDLSLPTKLARNRARTYSGTDSDDSGSGVNDGEHHHHHHHHSGAARRLKPEERKAAYKKSLMKRYCKFLRKK